MSLNMHFPGYFNRKRQKSEKYYCKIAQNFGFVYKYSNEKQRISFNLRIIHINRTIHGKFIRNYWFKKGTVRSYLVIL